MISLTKFMDKMIDEFDAINDICKFEAESPKDKKDEYKQIIK